MEGDGFVVGEQKSEYVFQSTPSAWRETRTVRNGCISADISIHSLRMEGDLNSPSISNSTGYISIHSLRMEGDPVPVISRLPLLYFNPLPPHGGRLEPCTSVVLLEIISIHSLRMEGDPVVKRHSVPAFSFQSTPSAWRETSTSFSARSISSHFNPLPPHGGRLNLHLSFPPIRYFNPLPPHGGRPLRSKVERNDGCISIHSLRMEGDKMFCAFITRTVVFQSTPSAWRETVSEQIISKPKRNFNPLPPHGGRQRN